MEFQSCGFLSGRKRNYNCCFAGARCYVNTRIAMGTEFSQLVANDLSRSFRIGARRIELLRGISREIGHGVIKFR